MKEYRINLNEEEINILNKYLDEFLLKLLESGVMPSANILGIINDKNSDISLNVLNNFINKSVEKEINEIEDQQKKFNKYNTQINETINELKDLQTKAYTVNLNKCSECGMPMNLPLLLFLSWK